MDHRQDRPAPVLYDYEATLLVLMQNEPWHYREKITMDLRENTMSVKSIPWLQSGGAATHIVSFRALPKLYFWSNCEICIK